jgi:hypothetical protein
MIGLLGLGCLYYTLFIQALHENVSSKIYNEAEGEDRPEDKIENDKVHVGSDWLLCCYYTGWFYYLHVTRLLLWDWWKYLFALLAEEHCVITLIDNSYFLDDV